MDNSSPTLWNKMLRREDLEDGRFILATPSYDDINAVLADHFIKPDYNVNTVHVGGRGMGKSLWIGALQELRLQTCHPYHGNDMTDDHTKLHTTNLGSSRTQCFSLDTQCLDEGVLDQESQATEDNERIESNLRILLTNNIDDVHAVFAHIPFSKTSNRFLCRIAEQSMRIGNRRKPQNIVIVVSSPQESLDKNEETRDRYKGIIKAFKDTAEKLNVQLPKVVITSLEFKNIRADKRERRQQTPGIAEFDYQTDRDALAVFILSVINEFDKPMHIERRNEYCVRRCGNKGDSRCFNSLCHHDLLPRHPPGFEVEAHTLEIPHNGTIRNRAHRFPDSGLPGKFIGGAFDGFLGFLGLGLNRGKWTCCGANKIRVAGCAQQWTCCKKWLCEQENGSKSICTRKICKQCQSDWDKVPSRLELQCTHCKAYVGVIPEGVVLEKKGPCRILQGDEKHSVAELDHRVRNV